MLSGNALVSLELVKEYLKIDSDDSYNVLEALIESATRKTEDYCSSYWIKREVTETRIGDGTAYLYLYRLPVVDITSVTLDGDELVLDTDYEQRLSIGRLSRSAWDKDHEIIVTYTAGYLDYEDEAQAVIPEAVLAVLTTIADWWNNPTGILSQSITGIGAFNFEAELQLPGKAKAKLSSLRQRIL